eukprot:GEMP01019984.1.p1 GENE.GEMP01019984.1~~GEMP01019984.1.p1  ORF type:complete len:484 (+),score=79.51 GEMP01019984.1:149-1600(+)
MFLYNDLWLRTLRFLTLASKNAAGTASQLLYVLSREAQRDPQAITLHGSLQEIGRQLRESLMSPPTFVIIAVDREVSDMEVMPDVTEFLLTQLPRQCAALALCCPFFGWGPVAHRNNGVFCQPFAQESATTPNFSLYCLSLADTISSGCDLHRESLSKAVPDNANTIFVAVSRQLLERDGGAISVLGEKFPDAQLLGATVEDLILVKNQYDVKTSCIAAIVLSTKNAFAITTRGVEAVSPECHVWGHQPVQRDVGMSGDTAYHCGNFITHMTTPGETRVRSAMEVYSEIQSGLRVQCAPVYFGLQVDDGYKICNVDSHLMAEEGYLWTSRDYVQRGMQCKFFQLRRKACIEDIEKKMRGLKQAAKQHGEMIAGCVMVSCFARDEHMMAIPNCDAELFHRACPDVPFLGLFTAREIGPVPIAESEAVFTRGTPELLSHTCCMMVFIVDPDKEGSPLFRSFERGDISIGDAVKTLSEIQTSNFVF